MQQAQFIYIMGDVHMRFDWLNHFIDREIRHNAYIANLITEFDEVEILLFVCGDFGYFPHWHGKALMRRDEVAWWGYILGHLKEQPKDEVEVFDQYGIRHAVEGIKDGHVKIYWADGNHENHDALNALEAEHPDKDFIPIMPWVHFARFGSVLNLLDGTRVMFCGGAQSIDKHDRTEGESWWAGEEIDEVDMARLPTPESGRVHWIISHTAPEAFKVVDFDLRKRIAAKDRDPSCMYLERVRMLFRPEQWWFGHYHIDQPGILDGCSWAALDCLEARLNGHFFETRLLTLGTERPRE